MAAARAQDGSHARPLQNSVQATVLPSPKPRPRDDCPGAVDLYPARAVPLPGLQTQLGLGTDARRNLTPAPAPARFRTRPSGRVFLSGRRAIVCSQENEAGVRVGLGVGERIPTPTPTPTLTPTPTPTLTPIVRRSAPPRCRTLPHPACPEAPAARVSTRHRCPATRRQGDGGGGGKGNSHQDNLITQCGSLQEARWTDASGTERRRSDRGNRRR
jgi:hypothetical protein